jgi:hypothetical protein
MFYLGLGLRRSNDDSAIVLVERLDVGVGYCPRCKTQTTEVQHHCRLVEQFDSETSYPEIIKRVGALTRLEPMRDHCTVVVNATQVGASVVDMIRNAGIPHRVAVITSGISETVDDSSWIHIPEKELSSCIAVLTQSKRLKFAGSLPEAVKLAGELHAYSARVTSSGNPAFEAHEVAHDAPSTVLAAVLAFWYSERHGVSGIPSPRQEVSPLQKVKML